MAGNAVVYRDGEKLTPLMAFWFDQMARDFYKDTGCTLHVSSGLRYGWEQEQVFLARYVRSYDVGGRYVYDWRWWNGELWGRISDAGTVATPKTSNHEFESTGVGAIDIYDSGGDPGVATRYTVRSNWMEENAWKYHYENEGFNFREAWHKKFLLPLWGPVPNSGASTDETPFIPATPTLEDLMATQTAVVVWPNGKGTYDGAVVDIENRLWSNWGQTDLAFAQGLAATFGNGKVATITPGYAAKLKADIDALPAPV
jgi:hypothetical protein